jgi:hypothetical protein
MFGSLCGKVFACKLVYLRDPPLSTAHRLWG